MLLAALGSALLLGGAFLFQLAGYPPCHLCLLQRWPHAAAILVGLVVLVLGPRLWLGALGALAALSTSGLGLYHTGVERGWWEGPSSCTGSGPGLGGMSGEQLLSPDSATRAVMCDQVSWEFLTLSMASWNALFSLVLAVIWIASLRRA